MNRLVWLVCLAGCGRLSVTADRMADAQGEPSDPPLDAADPLFRSCALYMAMDEAAWTGAPGEVIDRCGGHNGVTTDGAAIVNDAVRGRVGSFPMATSCVNVADAPSLRPTTALTISAWVQPTMLDNTNAFGIVTKRVDYLSDSTFAIFAFTNDLVYADIDTEDNRAPGGTPLVNGEWHQVTVVYDGTLSPDARVQFYRDGAPDGSITESSASISQFTGPLTAGCMELPTQSTDKQSLHGQMDDLIIWMRSLDATDVAAWYQRTKR